MCKALRKVERYLTYNNVGLGLEHYYSVDKKFHCSYLNRRRLLE